MFHEDKKLPRDIIEAYKRDKLVLFIGAGISRLMGCKGWGDMATTLISHNFNFKEAQTLNNAHLSDKEKITIAYKKSEKDGRTDEFYRIMRDALQPDKSKEDIYSSIAKCKCIYVTTNADGLLEQHHLGTRYNTHCTVDELDGINPPYLFYLHGRFGENTEEDRKSLIFTVDEYLLKYSNPEYIEFLDYLFSNYAVLFIGYGMNEFELLDHLFSKIKNRASHSHYILEGFCSDMDALVESKRMYYESLGIKLLTYCQDEEGYERQYKIIKGWIDQLSEETFYESDIFNSIKVCLEEYNKDNYEYILHVLCELDSDDKSYLDFVLENIPLSKDNYIYFEKLWHDGIISVNDCPKVVNSQDGYGYTAPYWKATDCMFHIISGSVQNIYIQNLAVEFMNKVIDKINADEEILKNFHLRYTVISIVLLLDSDHINQQCIDFLCRTYKFESFDTIGSEIMRSRPDWLKWDEDKINQMFEFIFGCESLNNKTFSNLHSYNLSKIYTKIKSILTEIQKAFIVKLCITNMIKSFENIRYQYFDSFETQLQDLEFEYEKVLETIIQDLLEFIDNEMIESIVSDSSRKINIQFALYLCKLMNMNITILNKFNINPLDIEGTIADFYCYLDAYQSCFSDNEAKNIIHLINSATFGENDNYSEYKKYVNTYKLSLYKMLKDKNSLFKTEYDELIKREYIQDFNPIDVAWEKVPQIETWHAPKIFNKNELSKFNLVEMLNKINDNKIYQRDIMYRESYEEIIDYFIEQDKFIHLWNMISNNDEIKFGDVCCIIMALSQDKYKEHYNNVEILTAINNLINRTYTIKESDDKTNCIKNILSILEFFFKNNSCKKKLFSLCLEINTKDLWYNKIYDGIFEENEIIGNMINDGECRLYLLLFSLIVDFKTRRINYGYCFEKFKAYFNEKISEKNKWFLLSCAYHFQNLFYLDNKWAKEIINSNFFDNEYKIDMIAVACSTSNYIIKELINKIFEDNNQINFILNKSDMTNDYKQRIIEYVVSAYLFGIINYEEYKLFLSYVYEELLKTVFGAIVAKTNGRIKNPVKDTYIESYKIIQDKINESETYSEIIRFAEDIPDTNKKYWNMISECLNKIDNTTYSWYDFDNLFNKNLGDNDFLYLDSLYVYIDKFVPSDIEMIISILNKLKSCNRENDVFKLCNKLLTRKIFVNEINEYITDLRKDYRKKTGK